MSTVTEDPKLKEYGRKLGWALSALPVVDRLGIIEEMRSHVLDRVDAGASVQAALEALGDPNDYARRFYEVYSVAAALSSRRTPLLISALVGGVARNFAAACAASAIFMTWSVAALIAYVAILKISNPAHVGLWRGEHFFFIGIINDPATGRELLGPWIAPLALVAIIVAWITTQTLASWALKRLVVRA